MTSANQFILFEMQTQPPDILVTNFTMLEYILLRDDDQQLFAHPECFRFLVLDEVHTGTGTKGMRLGYFCDVCGRSWNESPAKGLHFR